MGYRRETRMRHRQRHLWSGLQRRCAMLFSGPPILAFLPAFSLAVYWFGGEGALIVLAGLLPVIYLAGIEWRDRVRTAVAQTPQLLPAPAFRAHVEDVFENAETAGRKATLFALALEDFDILTDRYGISTAEKFYDCVAERLTTVLRDDDRIAQLDDSRFLICSSPVRHLDLERSIQLATRLQSVVEDPISVDGQGIYVTSSVGFCQHQHAPGKTAETWVQASLDALSEAETAGTTSIRAYSTKMRNMLQTKAELRRDLPDALEAGQIKPWFQPQVSTDTGRVTGFEALARWNHPEQGLITPVDFLDAVADTGQSGRLSEVMMNHAFAALKSWDQAGVKVPQVGVNFSGAELTDPQLVDKIKWELDRFDLSPDRLAVEILETVVASGTDDVITRNLSALSDLGCRIDLDDFGTGHASISSIRRFSVNRIKIDRSFVTKADRDPEQQRMITAILTMAERLEVETLAEGVETMGEHVLLAQLGCDHVQGFGIARPMPVEQTLEWMHAHNAKLTKMPRIMGIKGG